MLPVVFSPGTTAPAPDRALADFRRDMEQLGGAHASTERGFAQRATRQTLSPSLASFAWEPRAATLFGPGLATATPRFAHYARVQRAKPGADVLARHPSDPAPEGDQRAILLALQRYGRGQSAVLTSDALWRWKLDQPSRERGAEQFWQNLLAWLGRERQRGVRFERAPLLVAKNHELSLRLLAPPGPLRLTASPADPAKPGSTPAPPLPLAEVPDPSGARLFRWTPPSDGPWVLEAVSGTLPPTRHWLTVATPPGGENSGLPPDETLLRSLAERTGGAVLTDAPPPAWLAAASAPPSRLLRESIEPLWHQTWLFAALLALYLAELLLRRRSRLL